ncbi:unnamed protein product, partial [Brassica napus]
CEGSIQTTTTTLSVESTSPLYPHLLSLPSRRSFVKASKSDDEFCSAPSITESDEKPKPIYWKSHESNTLSFTPPRSFIGLSYQDLQY